uniref:Uncharacterized protein n=1 Tax=Anguilla anguilla TaxID=7936 RepID=A0A0E9UCC4_ANGAN
MVKNTYTYTSNRIMICIKLFIFKIWLKSCKKQVFFPINISISECH